MEPSPVPGSRLNGHPQHHGISWPAMKDSPIRAVVTSIGEPSSSDCHGPRYNFQLEFTAHQLSQIEDELQSISRNPLVETQDPIRPGEYVIASCANGRLCRAVVVDVLSLNCVRCLCVDSGHTVWLNRDRLYELDDMSPLRRLPWMSFSCVLLQKDVHLQIGHQCTLMLRAKREAPYEPGFYVAHLINWRPDQNGNLPIMVIIIIIIIIDYSMCISVFIEAVGIKKFIQEQMDHGLFSLVRVVEFILDEACLQMSVEQHDTEISAPFMVIY